MNAWENEPNKRALAIIRRSSSGQKDNTSADTQEREVREYCKRNGLEIIALESIIETAYTGERKKYHGLMDKALKGGIKHILFYLGNREARNLSDNEKNERLVKADRIIIHHVSENKVYWKGSSDSDFLQRDIQTSVNKNFSRENGTKVRAACRTKGEGGWWPYRHTPLGYVHSKKKDAYGNSIKGTATLIKDPNIKAVKQVQREFELKANGLSYDKIRNQIIKEGLISPSNIKKYHRSTIEKRLKNDLYYGYFYLTGDSKKYSGKHELIIPESIRKVVLSSIKGKLSKRPANEQGIFADGWIRCHHPECQRQLTYDPKTKFIKADNKETTYRYYRCTNSRGIHERVSSVNEDKIWNQFEAAVDLVSASEEFAKDVTYALNETHRTSQKAIKVQMQNYNGAIHSLKAEEDGIFKLLMDGTIDKDVYQRQLQKCRDQQKHYADQLEQANLTINDEGMISVQKVFELAINAKSLWVSMEREKRLEYLKRICSNSTLDGLTVRYELHKPFAMIAEMKSDSNWRRG